MFTGLIEGCGKIVGITFDGPAQGLAVRVPDAMLNDETRASCRLGDSVAINGCCLTVVDMEDDCWDFQAGPETLAKTNLGKLQPGDAVNLERPLRAGGELGGHFVQGHIDGVATVDTKTTDGDWVVMWFHLASDLLRYLAPKGSVAVDGISLTVVDVEPERFSVALIPHTLKVTTLGRRKRQDPVNIETDILAKYVERLFAADTHQKNKA